MRQQVERPRLRRPPMDQAQRFADMGIAKSSKPSSLCPFGVTSVALCDGWLPIDFRYAPFATEVMRRCKMLLRAMTGHPSKHRAASLSQCRARDRLIAPHTMDLYPDLPCRW